jgi:hypothetical protein
MPSFTSRYKIPFFATSITPYSAYYDKIRMNLIDQNMAYISEIFGNGVINGWEIIDNSTSNYFKVSISDGFGIINKFVTNTFGDISVDLLNNTNNYIYIKRLYQDIDTLSSFSDVSSILCVDSTIPNAPNNLVSDGVSFNYIKIKWDKNIEPDFSFYEIYRSEDNINYEKIASTSINYYDDSEVSQDTIYYYNVYSVDINNNKSSASSITLITDKDYTKPLNPLYFNFYSSSESIDLFWGNNTFGDLSYYRITIQEVNTEYVPIGDITSYDIIPFIYKYRITNIDNSKLYKIYIYSVNVNGILSDGLYVYGFSKKNFGPAEVSNLTATGVQSVVNSNGIALDISWNPTIDPYFSNPIKYILNITENGIIKSKDIESYNDNIVINIFTDTNGKSKNINSRTSYIISVKAQDSNGKINNGSVIQIATGNFIAPASVTNISVIQQKYKQILFSWNNSKSEFLYNYVRIKKNGVEIVNINYENGNNYLLNESYFSYSSLYEIFIYVQDEFGNVSNTVSYSYQTDSEILNKPGQIGVTPYSGDKNVRLEWPYNSNIDEYYIWRADGVMPRISSAYTLIETLPGSICYYNDYSVQNDSTYSYFVLMKNNQGMESLNPADNGYFSYNCAVLTPTIKIPFIAPSNITVTQSSYDAILTWTFENDAFDGYQIWKSIANTYSWEQIGQVDRNTSYYVDEGALIKNNTEYFYMIRKFRNQAEINISNRLLNEENTYLLGSVLILDGKVEITQLSKSVDGLEEYINRVYSLYIEKHYHDLGLGYDRRIDLSSSVLVSEWTTNDNRIFTTEQDIVGAEFYNVFIDGLPSSVFYNVNSLNKTITFSIPIEYSSLILDCIGLEETSGVLETDQIQGFFVNQINSGEVLKEQLPLIEHSGRTLEKLIPLGYKLNNNNGNSYIFNIYQNDFVGLEYKIYLPEDITFYDVLYISDSTYIAGGSGGIFKTSDNGESWSKIYYDKYGFHKLYYSSILDCYFALSGNLVYFSKNGLNWARTMGLENISIVRDITEDNSKVYISTDVGIYYISEIDLTDLIWNYVNINNLVSSNFFAIIFDPNNNRILSSNELGILESFDQGNSWSYLQKMYQNSKIYSFYIFDNYIFGISNDGVWRCDSSTFYLISKSNCFAEARKVVIFSEKIIITSNNGFMISNTNDIFTDTNISFEVISNFDFVVNGILDPSCLSVANSTLYFGSDGKLWTSSNAIVSDMIYDQYSESGKNYPTLFLEKNQVRLGWFYSKNYIVVDDIMNNLTIVKDYSVLKSENGGWIGNNYNSNASIFKNNIEIANFSSFPVPLTTFNSFSFPEFTEFNSNSVTAKAYLVLYEKELLLLNNVINSVVPLPPGDSIQNICNRIILYFYQIYSQWNGKTKFIIPLEISSIGYKIVDFQISLSSVFSDLYNSWDYIDYYNPMFSTSGIVQLDSVNGIMEITSINKKYDSFLITLHGSNVNDIGTFTHKELEDKFSITNSGLGLNFSEIVQSNISKNSLFINNYLNGGFINPTNLCEYASPINTKLISFKASDYNLINSTVNYSLEINSYAETSSPSFVTSVVYVQEIDRVLIGTDVGLYYLYNNSYSIGIIDFNNLRSEEMVNNIYKDNSSLYILGEGNIYKSDDYGVTWNSFNNYGISGNLNKILSISNNLVINTDNGIYYYNVLNSIWKKSNYSLIADNIFLLDELILAFTLNKFYKSFDGITWISIGEAELYLNNSCKYKSLSFSRSDKGLYSDGATIQSENINFSLVDLKNNTVLSKELYFNDIAASSELTKIVAGSSNGLYWVYDGTSWVEYSDSNLDVIHKVLLVGNDIWLFGNNEVKISSFSEPIVITTGVGF